MEMAIKSQGTAPQPCRVLLSERYDVGGKSATCRLLGEALGGRCFCIEIELEGESARVMASRGYARSAEIFWILVGASVTPCTLDEIMEDLLLE
ncbi:MAG: hypothetical protein IKD28_00660 [Clostridia bacterium]|nr:hypothetical protein [Clostridia bacterium]